MCPRGRGMAPRKELPLTLDTEELLVHYLTDGIRENHKHHVGIELEFPMITTDGRLFNVNTARRALAAAEEIGFAPLRAAHDGTPLAVRDGDKNVLTFDTCYENMEFASASAPSLWPLYRRFRETLAAVQKELLKGGHCLLGVGYNPFLAKTQNPHMIESELTLAIAEYFRHHAGKRRYDKDFYCYISSEQIHFNTTPEELPLIFEFFTRIDWLNMLLFADSPALIAGKKYLCARNELYMRSSFRELGLVGAQALGPRTAEEIAKTYENICLFMHERDGKLSVFPPVAVRDYFASPEAREEDIHHLDLERNIVTTSYGTVEYRVLCAQPFDRCFTPSAFNLGLRTVLPEALALARDFDARHDMPAPNERNREASTGVCAFSDIKDTLSYAREMLRLSQKGLRERGFGEEAMLAPLQSGENLLVSPAARLMRMEKEMGERPAYLTRAALGAGFTEPTVP